MRMGKKRRGWRWRRYRWEMRILGEPESDWCPNGESSLDSFR